MMTMSKALSAGQAKDYYQQEFTSAKGELLQRNGRGTGTLERSSCGRVGTEWRSQERTV